MNRYITKPDAREKSGIEMLATVNWGSLIEAIKIGKDEMPVEVLCIYDANVLEAAAATIRSRLSH